ncbi:hypothetical protein A0128_20370 [Leptospira tipperaryensis]|uniref:Uncharacterized protein n=1 Tax=Leptospira tipperaryensis TaxID=2564040 RepID=A0A1D7V3E4_9LEPT|nr:hypothetical protein [Leptospira tipperaryensis]AOP36375.1 hypothetical protein A0128_20370 [Leptospira tipperaryensis]
MKKIEFNNKIKQISNFLKSKELSELVDVILSERSPDRSFSQDVISLLIESKSGFDKLIMTPGFEEMLIILDGNEIYDTPSVTSCIRRISGLSTKHEIFKDLKLIKLLNMNRAIYTIAHKFDSVLFSENPYIENNVKNDIGLIVFESADYGNSLSKYANALMKIEKILDLLKSIFEEENEGTYTVLYFESGSAADVVVKTSKKIAGAFSQTIFEIWRFVADHGNYKEARKDEALEKKLELINKIGTLEAEGKISKEDARNFKVRIKKQIIDLMEFGVVTREVAESIKTVNGRAIIAQQIQKLPPPKE